MASEANIKKGYICKNCGRRLSFDNTDVIKCPECNTTVQIISRRSEERYVVFRESDMTEGSGPFVIDSIWLTYKDAAEYIDQQPGVMGRIAKWSEEKYGDWKIETWIVNGVWKKEQ